MFRLATSGKEFERPPRKRSTNDTISSSQIDKRPHFLSQFVFAFFKATIVQIKTAFKKLTHDSDGHRVRSVLPLQVEGSASVVATVVPSNALQY